MKNVKTEKLTSADVIFFTPDLEKDSQLNHIIFRTDRVTSDPIHETNNFSSITITSVAIRIYMMQIFPNLSKS